MEGVQILSFELIEISKGKYKIKFNLDTNIKNQNFQITFKDPSKIVD